MTCMKRNKGLILPLSDIAVRLMIISCASVWLSLSAGLAVSSAADDVTPLIRAHAHNDYLHERPLLDALDHGFTSIEADVWLVDGELLVAHDRDKVSPERTLEGLYLDPLLERVRANGGRVYPDGPELLLLIDFKSEGETTFPALYETLERYGEMLTVAEDGKVRPGAVRLIVSGSRPRALMEQQTPMLAFYDGRLDDLGTDASPVFMPLVSSSWMSDFSWTGRGPMPEEERAKLDDIVRQAHGEGRLVRFWAISHREAFWDVMVEAGVDLINADRLEMLRDYLLATDADTDGYERVWPTD